MSERFNVVSVPLFKGACCHANVLRNTDVNTYTCLFFRHRATSTLPYGAICDHIILWGLNDHRGPDLDRSLHRHTLAILIRAMLHARKRAHHYNVFLDFYGDLLEYSLPRGSSEARYTHKILLLLSVPFASLSAHYVLAGQYIDYRHLVVY